MSFATILWRLNDYRAEQKKQNIELKLPRKCPQSVSTAISRNQMKK